jgi:isoleucyl-tRNA synthetase
VPDCGWFDVVGSEGELKEKAIAGWEDFEGRPPHRPYVDAVKIRCQNCGATASRIADVGNPWLDAGIVAFPPCAIAPTASTGSKWFPADLITESFPGQFRNWFYSMLAMSTIMERRAPFRTVQTYATLFAEDGRAMHKSWGNSIEFNDAADTMGVDVMRWMYCAHKPENNLLFGYHRADEIRRRFLIPLVERLLLLCDLCQHRRLAAGRAAAGGPAPAPRPLDPGAPEPGGCPGHRGHGGL